MKLILDDNINTEIKDYLLLQAGIIDVSLSSQDFFTILDIKYNEKTTPNIIFKYIEMFQKHEYPILFEFDKETFGHCNTLEYTVDDMCCEYCYKGLVEDLFENLMVKSVKSNFDYKKAAFNIKFTIEYNNDYSEEELVNYIKKNINDR